MSVFQFFSPRLEVKLGSTVAWKNDSFEPHVIALGATPSPEDPRNFMPPSVPPGSRYSGGVAISGFIGAKPWPRDSFSLRFVRAGTFTYTCPIHPGMTGVIAVSL